MVVISLVGLLLTICPVLGKVSSFRRDDTTECLSDITGSCDQARSCSFHTYEPSCLAAPIPYATSIDHDRVSCCFKCCHYHFTQLNKLNTNESAFQAQQPHLPLYNLAELSRDNNLLLSNSRMFQMSHSINRIAYPSYKVTTFQDLNGTLFDGSSRVTKRAVFVDVEGACVSLDVLGPLATRTSGQGVHALSMLFTKHLPCPAASEVAEVQSSRNERRLLRAGAKKNNNHNSKNKKSLTPFADAHPGHSRSRLNSRGLQHILSLVPYGVRSTLAATAVSGVVRPAGENRARLLDCTCARQHAQGREMIQHSIELQQLCSYHHSPSAQYDDVIGEVDEFNSTQMDGLAGYYKSLTSVKFTLSPTDGSSQSYCEWEGLAFGAIPVLIAVETKPEVDALFRDLPVHVVGSVEHMDETYLTTLHKVMMDNLMSKPSSYSMSKLFHPHWLHLMSRHFSHGKPAQRPWRHVDMAFKKSKIDGCAFDKKGNAGGGKTPKTGSPSEAADSEVTASLPDRFQKLKDNAAIQLKKTRSSKTLRGRDKFQPKTPILPSPPHRERRNLEASGGELAESFPANSTLTPHSSLSTPIDQAVERSLTAADTDRDSTSLVEIVIPRCCESGVYELEWLLQLLTVTDSSALSVSIYYKCLECLPASLAYDWMEDKSTMLESDYDRKHNFTSGTQRITLLDDSPLVAFGSSRVKQYPLFDRVHNGKEVTAYLRYIIDRHGTLPTHVVFLHTSPHAHLHLPLLPKFLKYVISCESQGIRPVDFLHLNVHYKGAGWGSCCGRKGLCRENTWRYLFADYPEMGPVYSSASTYSSAQFVASRRAIMRWPVSFWRKMMMAINGENDLGGCPHSSDPNVPSWGGHQLTGQYERMWHIIFGQKHRQMTRRQDTSLPTVLRLDCIDEECRSGAL